jgi:uncharacterized protein
MISTVRRIRLLNFRKLQLEDKVLLESYLQGIHYENTELSFSNLYIWRQSWNIEICEHDGVLYFSYRHPDTGCIGHMQPVVPHGQPVMPAVRTAVADLKARQCGLDIMGVNEDFAARFRSEEHEGFEITEDRDLMEYVYLRDELDRLPGKKFHNKRNHINKFDSAYAWQELTPDLLPQCLSISCEWFHSHEDSDAVDEGELSAIKEAIVNMKALGLIGALLCVDGKPKAFTIGEYFRPDMALVHFEKADPTIPGLYAFINQQFVHRNFMGMTYINREEDMGIPGLRRAKESYNPVRMIDKYRIRDVQA